MERNLCQGRRVHHRDAPVFEARSISTQQEAEAIALRFAQDGLCEISISQGPPYRVEAFDLESVTLELKAHS